MNRADEQRFWAKVRVGTGEGCWEWAGGRSNGGYGAFWLEGHQVRAHRVAYELEHGHGTDLFVLHLCDNRGCVRPAHLYAGTHTDNMRDRMAHGRTARGDRMPHARAHGSAHPRAKLTERYVLEIRAAYKPGLGGELMRRYGISQASLWNIVNRRTWRHV